MPDEPRSPDAADDPVAGGYSRSGVKTANVDGFVALFLIALFLGFLFSFSKPRRVTGDFLFESIALLMPYAGAWLFAISGVRRGAEDGRVAAMTALALLVASVALVLAVFIRSLWTLSCS